MLSCLWADFGMPSAVYASAFRIGITPLMPIVTMAGNLEEVGSPGGIC